MSDLISRSKLIEEMQNDLALKYTGDVTANFISGMIARQNEIEKIIRKQPTNEAKEIVHGEWIKTFRYMRENINTGKLEPVYSCDCPICKWHTGNQGTRFNFCPNCGEDMRKKV